MQIAFPSLNTAGRHTSLCFGTRPKQSRRDHRTATVSTTTAARKAPRSLCDVLIRRLHQDSPSLYPVLALAPGSAKLRLQTGRPGARGTSRQTSMLVPVTVIGTLLAAICRPPRRSGAARTGRLATVVARAGQAAAIPPARGSTDKPGAKAAAPSASAMSTAHVIDVLISALKLAECGGLVALACSLLALLSRRGFGIYYAFELLARDEAGGRLRRIF